MNPTHLPIPHHDIPSVHRRAQAAFRGAVAAQVEFPHQFLVRGLGGGGGGAFLAGDAFGDGDGGGEGGEGEEADHGFLVGGEVGWGFEGDGRLEGGE